MTASPLPNEPARARTIARVLRIIARAFSLLLLAFAVVLFIAYTREGEGPFNNSGPRQNVAEPWEGVLMLVGFAGVIIAWRWELLGGALTVGSMALFEIIALLADNVTRPSVMLGPPGVCFLLAGLVSLWAKEPRPPSPPAVTGPPASPHPIGS